MATRLTKEQEARDSQGRRRVVISGYEAIGPGNMGLNAGDFWNSLIAGQSGIDYLRSIDSTGNLTTTEFDNCAVRIGGQLPILNTDRIMDPGDRKRNHQVTHLSAVTAYGAMERAQLMDPTVGVKFKDDEEKYRFGEVVASAASGTARLGVLQRTIDTRGEDRVGGTESLFTLAERPGIFLCKLFDLKGWNFLPVSACQSSGASLAIATNLIRSGVQDVVLAGGVENPMPIDSPIETHLSQSLFIKLRALTKFLGNPPDPTKASRPFNKNRDQDGFVMSSGSGILVLEDYAHAMERDAPIFGEVIGVSITNDGQNVVSDTLSSGEGSMMSMRLALRDAGISPDAVDLLVAHATSTPGDEKEVQAIKQVFGNRPDWLSVYGPKSMTGHLLGASGGNQAWQAMMAILNGIIPPTINMENPCDPDLDFTPNTAREKDVNVALSNSFGFGNGNSTIALRRLVLPRWN